MSKPFVVWHRPEYQGRENELLNQNDIATLAGVTRSAVSNWCVRHPGFPDVVVVHGAARHLARLYVAAEIETWLADRAASPRKKPGAARKPHRPRREILAERVDRASRQIETEEQRIDELYRELGKATERLKRAQAALEAARNELAAGPAAG